MACEGRPFDVVERCRARRRERHERHHHPHTAQRTRQRTHPAPDSVLPPAIPALDPVAQLLAEERHESTLMRLVLCAVLSVGLLALAGGLLV